MAISPVQAFRDVPRGAKVARAFAAQAILGEARFRQEHRVPANYWLDLGFEWQSVDVPTLLITWPFLKIAISVDGTEIANPKQNSKGPSELILQTPHGMHIGYAMQNALCIPPLPLGDHTIELTIRFERALDDGWTVHPKGREIMITSVIHVIPPAHPPAS
jgi:hypothetical protein